MLDASPKGALVDNETAPALGISLPKLRALKKKGESLGMWKGVRFAILTHARWEEDEKAEEERDAEAPEEEAAVDASIQESMREARARAEAGRVVIR